MAKVKGFGHMKQHDPDRLKEIASQGGRASQDKGSGHRWTPGQAKQHAAAGGRAKARNQKGKD